MSLLSTTFFSHQRRRLAAPLVLLALVLAAGSSWANPCDRELEGVRTGPVNMSFLEADLGAARRTCPRSEAGFGGQAGVVFEPEKYGLDFTSHIGDGSPLHVSGAARVFGSLRLTRKLEIFGSFQPVNARLIRSSFQETYIGLGNTSAGATLVAYETGPFALGVTGQITLPTAVGYYRTAWPVGLDSGLVFVLEPFEFFRLHGQLSGVGSVAITTAAFDPRAGMVGVLGAEFLIFDWVNIVVDANGFALYEGTVDHLAVAAGVRSKIWAGLGVEALVIAPVIGTERTLARARVNMSYRF